MTGPRPGTNLGAALARVLASVWAADPNATPVAVEDLRRLSGGASRETWAFTASAPGHEHEPLVLQRRRDGDGGGSGGVDMAVEADVLRAAGRTGVPVARIVTDAHDDRLDDGARAGLGPSWIITAMVEGETIARRILRDDGLRAARAGLTEQVGAALAAVHRIAPAEAPGLAAGDPVDSSRSLLDAFGQPHPAFELTLRWLAAHRPPPTAPVVVHGDLRMGNLVVGPDGLRAVLDWELAHLGDAAEDLGWLCVRAWRFGGALPVGGFGRREDLLSAYAAAGGAAIDPTTLHWWEVYGTLRWGLICIVQAAAHRSGIARSVELAAIGRRVCETEHDLLGLIAPDAGPAGEPADGPGAAPPAGPHDVPTAAELLEAVEGFLRDDVMSATTGRTAFHARVAANVVAIVRREVELGPGQGAAHAARLAAFGVADDAALAGAIRTGALEEREEEVVAAVRAAVDDKLAVAHPGYADDAPPVQVGGPDTAPG